MLTELRAIVGAANVLVGSDASAFEVDWTRRYRGNSLAVVRPGATVEVAAVVAACRERSVPIVPQGGNTGMVGGGVPDADGRSIVLATTRLTGIDLDVVAGQVTVGAGVTLAALQNALSGTSWEFGVDLGARGSCTIGGMIATNAGGTRVLRHGSMRTQVLGVEAVLADGTVIRRLSGLVKDNTGYDLGALLCGSEGTLGVVTAARLRLVSRPIDRVTVLAAVTSVSAALDLCARLRSQVDGLDTLEALLGDALDVVCDELGLRHPFSRTPPVTLLAEWAGHGEPPTAFADAFDGLDHRVATEPSGRARLWRYRDELTLAISHLGVPHKLDVTLPFGRLAEFAESAPTLAAPHRVVLFGHLGDGNLHVNVLGPAHDDYSVDDLILAAVIGLGGSISAEHGIGRAKAAWLERQHTAADFRAMRNIKHALDPTNLFNPGVIFPTP